MAKHNSETLAYTPQEKPRSKPSRETTLLDTRTEDLRKKKPDQKDSAENVFLQKMYQAHDITDHIKKLDTELAAIAKKIDKSDEDVLDISEFEDKKSELDTLYQQLENIQNEYIKMAENQSSTAEENTDEEMHGFLSAIEARNAKQLEIIPTKVEKIKSKWDSYSDQFGPEYAWEDLLVEDRATPASDSIVEELAQKEYELKQLSEKYRQTPIGKRPVGIEKPGLYASIEKLRKTIPANEMAEFRKKINRRIDEIKQESEEREAQAQVDDALREILPLLEQKARIQSEKIENTDTRRRLDQISVASKINQQINTIIDALPANITKIVKTELVWISKELTREATERRNEETTRTKIVKDFTPSWQQEPIPSAYEKRPPVRAEKEKNETRERAFQVRNELIDMKRNVSRFTFGGLWGAFKNKLRFSATETGSEPSKDEIILMPDQFTNGLAIADPKPENLDKIIKKLSKSSKPYDQADAKMLQDYDDKLSELIKLPIQL